MGAKIYQYFGKKCCVDVCKTFLSDYRVHLKCLITGNEICIYEYEPETTDQFGEYRAKGVAI